MVSSEVQIADLRSQIRRKQAEIDHTQKVLTRQPQAKLMTSQREKELLDYQKKLFLEIQDIEREIRKIENEDLRRQNIQP